MMDVPDVVLQLLNIISDVDTLRGAERENIGKVDYILPCSTNIFSKQKYKVFDLMHLDY